MTDSVSTYRGVTRRGDGRGGSTTETPRVLVRAKFDQGWRSLIMTRDGIMVGEIYRHLDPPHRRTWWATEDA